VSSYRTAAVILRKVDYGEADRIYTLLTRDHGKVGAIAKGVRRTASRLAPALELFSLVDVQLAGGRNLDVVTQAVRMEGPRIEADVERTAHASLIAELADRVSEDRHPVEGLFELTVLALHELAREAEPRRASAYFMVVALDLLGYAPQLRHCAGCGKPLPEAPAAFSAPAGGFLCPDCAVPGMRPVSVQAIKVLRAMATGGIELYRRLRLDEALMAEVEGVLEAQLEHHLDRQLRSLRFLRQMRAHPQRGRLPPPC
jgi:DNA repair protein RecO (recombination protein O)